MQDFLKGASHNFHVGLGAVHAQGDHRLELVWGLCRKHAVPTRLKLVEAVLGDSAHEDLNTRLRVSSSGVDALFQTAFGREVVACSFLARPIVVDAGEIRIKTRANFNESIAGMVQGPDLYTREVGAVFLTVHA